MRVMFHGYLRDMVPDGIENIDFAVKTVGECVKAVSTQIPAFNEGPRKVAQILGVSNEHDLLREDVEVVHVVPAFVGGKRGGLFQILLGGILIAASIFLPGLGTIAGVALNTILFNVGLSLALSGIASLLAPKPVSNSPSFAQNPEGSKYLGAEGNTVRIGTRIPLGYGRQKVYGHILSFNVSTQTLLDPATDPSLTPSGPLSLSQGPISLGLQSLTRTLTAAQGGTSPYTYTLSNISTPLTFNANTRLLTVATGSQGGRICQYTVTDSAMNSVSLAVIINYDTIVNFGGGGGP